MKFLNVIIIAVSVLFSNGSIAAEGTLLFNAIDPAIMSVRTQLVQHEVGSSERVTLYIGASRFTNWHYRLDAGLLSGQIENARLNGQKLDVYQITNIFLGPKLILKPRMSTP